MSIYKTEGRSSKDFRNYQNPEELFRNLKDGNVNPRQVIKYQINFKSDLQSFEKYFWQTLVFMWNSTLWEKNNFCCKKIFTSTDKTFISGGGLSTRQ